MPTGLASRKRRLGASATDLAMGTGPGLPVKAWSGSVVARPGRR